MRITEAFLLSSGYESWRDNQKLELSVLLLKCQLHRIRNFELCQFLCFFGIRVNFSIKRVSVPWNMQRVVFEIWSKLSRDDFRMLYDANFDVTWQINPIYFQAPFLQKKWEYGFYLKSCLPDRHSNSDPSQLVFNVADCHITTLQIQAHVVEVAEYIGQIRKHHNKLFIAK